MYVEAIAPAPLAGAFASLAAWSPEGPSPSVLLPADPGFEIVWAPAADGALLAPPTLTPAHRRPRLVGANVAVSLRFLRFRPEAVGRWTDAAALADGPATALTDLGWREAARARTERELLHALAAQAALIALPDPLARRSLARLGDPFSQIAAAEGYSYEQWLRRMKAATGVSPRFLARYRALRRAARLARAWPRLSMAEVAFRAGFAHDAALAHTARDLAGRTFRDLAGGFTLPE